MARKNSDKRRETSTRKSGTSQDNCLKNPKSRLTGKCEDSKIAKRILDQKPKSKKNGIASKEVPLLAGYYFPQLDKQLKQYKSRYRELPNEGTATAIKNIQAGLKNEDKSEGEFKFTPILHGKHWCCGVITCDKVYVFDSTLQTQEDESSEKGMLKIGDYEKCQVIYLNHGKQIQSDDGSICGPCVVAFAQEIAKLDSIGKIIKGCESGDILKGVVQGVYNEFICELQGKSLQDEVVDDFSHKKITYGELIKSQFIKEYYDAIDKAIAPQQQADKLIGQLDARKGKGTANAAFGNIPKNPSKDKIPLFEGLSQITITKNANKIETVEVIGVPIRRSHSVPTKTSKSKGELSL